jgi:hypothetical protein
MIQQKEKKWKNGNNKSYAKHTPKWRANHSEALPSILLGRS